MQYSIIKTFFITRTKVLFAVNRISKLGFASFVQHDKAPKTITSSPSYAKQTTIFICIKEHTHFRLKKEFLIASFTNLLSENHSLLN